MQHSSFHIRRLQEKNTISYIFLSKIKEDFLIQYVIVYVTKIIFLFD